MKASITIGLLFCFVSLSAQSILRGTVRDANTDAPLAYCSVAIKGSSQGTITNEAGVFELEIHPGDTLLFSYIGYETKVLDVKDLRTDRNIMLIPAGIRLQEVTVRPNDDFIFEILDRCRDKIRAEDRMDTSKVYFAIETESEGRPVELLECYYNAYQQGPSIDRLLLKNGRVGMADTDGHFFASLDMSRGICDLKLTERDYFPSVIFQFSRWRMKRLYDVRLKYMDDAVYHISFTPREEDPDLFSGEIWIDKNTHVPNRIYLDGARTDHPFKPIFPSDTIDEVQFDITIDFREDENSFKPEYIEFDYSMRYKSVRDTPQFEHPSTVRRRINSDGILYFYDYGRPFILPFFTYNPDIGDYRKISFIPYSKAFWDENNAMILTGEQREHLGILAQEGFIIHFDDELSFLEEWEQLSEGSFFENSNIFWKADERLRLKNSLKRHETMPQDLRKRNFRSDLYDLRVQILLDITRIRDSLQWRSYTILDVFRSFYHLAPHSQTNAFLNIYFDLCELERRSMEDRLDEQNRTLFEIETIYRETVVGMEELLERYIDETQLGENISGLKRWNEYVNDRLGIDNMLLFGREQE